MYERECVTRMPPLSVNKAAYSGFETQRRRHQKSKTGVSVAPQKGLMASKKNLKKERCMKIEDTVGGKLPEQRDFQNKMKWVDIVSANQEPPRTHSETVELLLRGRVLRK